MKLPPYDLHYTEAHDERKHELTALRADGLATRAHHGELATLTQLHREWRARHAPLRRAWRWVRDKVNAMRPVVKAFHHHCHPGMPYLIRLRLLSLFGWHLNLHIFLRSDADPELHDHPWNFWSLVLAGGYYEVTEQGRLTRRAGSFAYRPATWRHRVELALDDALRPIPCATLVLTSPMKRDWGFWKGNLFLPWKTVVDREGPCL